MPLKKKAYFLRVQCEGFKCLFAQINPQTPNIFLRGMSEHVLKHDTQTAKLFAKLPSHPYFYPLPQKVEL